MAWSTSGAPQSTQHGTAKVRRSGIVRHYIYSYYDIRETPNGDLFSFINSFSIMHALDRSDIRRSFALVIYMSNPRYKNGTLRRKHRARLKAMEAPCGICRGRLGPIHYDEPSDAQHPLSFVVDEIRPVSKWRMFGYPSPEAAAQDWSNLQAAHYCCNQAKSDKIASNGPQIIEKKVNIKDGDW